MGFAKPHRLSLYVLPQRERESSFRHELIVLANEFHFLSHSKFVAIVKKERVREKKHFIIVSLRDLNEHRNEFKSTLEPDRKDANYSTQTHLHIACAYVNRQIVSLHLSSGEITCCVFTAQRKWYYLHLWKIFWPFCLVNFLNNKNTQLQYLEESVISQS